MIGNFDFFHYFSVKYTKLNEATSFTWNVRPYVLYKVMNLFMLHKRRKNYLHDVSEGNDFPPQSLHFHK